MPSLPFYVRISHHHRAKALGPALCLSFPKPGSPTSALARWGGREIRCCLRPLQPTMIPLRTHSGEAMRLGKLALISSSLLITLSPSSPNVAQAAQTTPTSGAPPAPASIDVPDIQTLHVTAREVVVDVMVTDAQGNSVNGLQQSDFSIEENGHPQTIRSFREYTPATQPPEPPFVRLPPGVYTNTHRS